MLRLFAALTMAFKVSIRQLGGLDRVATLYMHALHSSQLYLLYHLLHIMCAARHTAAVTAECYCMSEMPCCAGAVCCRPHTSRAFSRQSESASPVGWWSSHVESSDNDRLQGNLPGHVVL